MGEGFKVGSAFIDVDADATAAVAKLRRQLAAAKGPLSKTADEIGDEFGRRLGSKIEKHMKAAKGRISSIASDIGNDAGSKIVSTMDKQLKGAKGRLGNTATGLGETVAAKVSSSLTKTLGTKLDASLQAKAKGVGDGIGNALGDGVDDGGSRTITKSSKIKKSLDSVADRAQAQFKGMVFAGAFAGLPAAAAIAAAGTVASLAIIPLALVAGAAKLQAGNDDVARSYQQLGDTATNSLTRASSVLAGPLIKGTDKLTQGMLRLEPAMTGAFKLAAPAIDGVVDSVLTFTNEAMPGMITGLTQTKTVMTGVEALAKGTGRGVSDFFANVSTGSQSAAVNSATLGRVIQDLLGFAGTLLANLSNGGTTILPMFANSLSQIYGVIETLTGSGIAPLVGGVSGFITVVSGALGVVQALAGGLGGWLGPLAAAVGAFKAMDMLTFGKLTGGLSGIGTSIKAADGARGKLAAGLSGLAGLFTPGNVAAAALTIGLFALGSAQQAAAQRAAEHKARIADLSGALRDSNGAVNENVRALAAKALSETSVAGSGKKVLEMAREQGVSLADLTSAYLGNEGAQKRVTEQLGRYGQSVYDASKGGAALTEQQRGQISDNFALTEAVKGSNTEYGKAVQANRDLAAASAAAASAVGGTTPAIQNAAQASGALRAAWATMYSPLTSVTDAANALTLVLDRLHGRVPSYEEAVQSSNDTLRSMADSLNSAEFAANGFGDALLNSDGTVSTWTKNGSDLQNNLVTLQGGFTNAAASIHGLVAGGLSYDAAAQQVNATLTTQRDKFVELAQKMGLSGEQANALADKYGLIPSEVVTTITDYGSAVSTSADVDTLTGKLKGMPADTPVRITSITAEAEAKLVSMNYTVTHMDDGTVLVFANTSQASSAVAGVQGQVNSLQSKTITITVNEIRNAQAYSASVGGVSGQATGGYQFPASRFGGKTARHRDTGGTLSAMPGLAGASWTGERGPELSFPTQTSYIATNQQSLRFERRAKAGELAIQRDINIASPDPAVAPSIQLTINVYPSAEMDVDAFVDKVARKTQRLLNGGS